MFDTKQFTLAARVVFILLLATSLVLFVSISLTEHSLTIRWDRIGFVTFFQLFDIPIKLLAASFAVFIVWITLIRVEQTTRQLDILDDNNRFNNFFKHADEFHKSLAATPLLEELAKSSKLDARLFSSALHRYFYAESYNQFRQKIRPSASQEIDDFFESLSSSQFNKENCVLLNLPLEMFVSLQDKVSPLTITILDPLIKRIAPIDDVLQATGKTFDQIPPEMRDNIQRWTTANTLYWTEFTYRAVLGFQGLPQPATGFFESNFQRLRTDFGRYLESLQV